MLLRNAIFKAMLSASDEYSRGEQQNLVKSTELLPLANRAEKREVALECDKFLQDLREIAQKHKAPDAVRVTLIGLADVRTVHYLLHKPDESRGTFNSVAQIGHQFCLDLSTALGVPVKSKWAAPVAKAKAKAVIAVDSGVKEFSASGKWTNAHESFERMGFVVGATVLAAKAARCKENVQTIKEVQKAKEIVILVDARGAEVSHAMQVFLENKFTLYEDCFECGLHALF